MPFGEKAAYQVPLSSSLSKEQEGKFQFLSPSFIAQYWLSSVMSLIGFILVFMFQHLAATLIFFFPSFEFQFLCFLILV